MQEITLKRPAIKKPVVTTPGYASCKAHALIIAAIVAGAAFVDLLRLGAPSIWTDEAITIQLARLPLHTLYAAYSSGANSNMILYYLFMHGWLSLGGLLHIPASETFVRFPSALFAVLASVVVYRIGLRFFGRLAALLGALIFTLNGWQLTYAQDARSYSLQLLLVSLTWLGLLMVVASATPTQSVLRFEWRDARQISWRWWSLFVLSGALSVYAQPLSGLALVALTCAFGLLVYWPSSWRARARGALPTAAAGFLAIIVLIAPYAWISLHSYGAYTGWLPAPTVSNLLRHAATIVQKERHTLVLALILALALAVALSVAALLMLRARSPRARSLRARLLRRDGGALTSESAPIAAALACWLVIPVVMSYVVSLGGTRIFSGRYLLVVLPPLSLLVGVAIARMPWRAPRLGLCVVCALALLALAPSYYAHAQVEDWRGPARWLEQRYQPGDGLVAYNNSQACELPIDYYAWADGSQAQVTPDSPGALYVNPVTFGDPTAHYKNALNPALLATFAAHHPRIFFIAGRLIDNADVARVKATEAWLDAHYRFVGQTSSGIVTIRLYDTTP